MTNENIYARECFTYLIGWSKYKTYYYGARYAKNCKPSDLWTIYFTSSRGKAKDGLHSVKSFREEFGEPDIIQIRKTFGLDKHKCLLWEKRFLTKIDARNNIAFLNLSNGISKHPNNEGKKRSKEVCDKLSNLRIGKSSAYDTNGNYLGIVLSSDPRWKTGEIVGNRKGNKVKQESIDLRINTFKQNRKNLNFLEIEEFNNKKTNKWRETVKNSENWIAGVEKRTKPMIGTCLAVDQNRNKLGRISVYDPRWKTGEIMHPCKGVKRPNKKPSIKKSAPPMPPGGIPPGQPQQPNQG